MKLQYQKATRLARELSEELQRLEHRLAEAITGFDASDELTNVRAARDKAEEVRETINLVN